MIAVTCAKGKTIALFGLGKSGRSTALALMAGGAAVTAWDDNPDMVLAAQKDGIETADLHDAAWANFDSLVLSPGVPLTHPEPHWTAVEARKAGVEIVGDVELFVRERRARGTGAKLVAITGTNGKSTTTALISHVLRAAGHHVAMGGNIGVPVLELAAPAEDLIYVVECSSYQIDLAPSLDADIGILLNLSPDHLDRHGSMENYAVIKQQLVKNSAFAIVGTDDVWCASIANVLAQAAKPLQRITLAKGADLDLSNARALRGAHNLQNALAARAACAQLGLSDEEIAAGLASFGGLAHRMQIVGEIANVMFINDSKATNADAAEKSLSSFQPIYWIAGGLAKEGGITALVPLLGRVKKAFLIGEAAPIFAATLGTKVPYEICGTLDVAVSHAAKAALDDGLPHAAVLLAPAAASFDQFANFEKRGEAFCAAVAAILDAHAPAQSAEAI